MKTPRKWLLITSALVAPWLTPGVALAQEVAVKRSGQDNIDIVGASESDVEREIHKLGQDEEASSQPGAVDAEDDGIPPAIHRIADEIGATYKARDYETVFSLLSANPLVRSARPEVNVLEAWSYHNNGKPSKALDLFMSLYKEDPSLGNADGILFSGMASDFYTKSYDFAAAQGGPLADILKPGEKTTSKAPTSELEQKHLDFLNGWLAAAIRYGKIETATKVARLLGKDNLGQMSGAAQIGKAWRLYKAGDFEGAYAAFGAAEAGQSSAEQKKEAFFGQVLALKASGKIIDALNLLSTASGADPRLDEIKASLELTLAYRHFESERYFESLGLSRALQDDNNNPRAAWLLEGWSLNKLNENEKAAAVFVAAYRRSQDEESANGVVASLLALGRPGDVAALAAELGGPLHLPPEGLEEPEPWVVSKTDTAYYRGDFAIAATDYPELAQTLHSWIGGTASYKYRDGEDGLGLLKMIGTKASLDLTDRTVHTRAELEVMRLSSEAAPLFPESTGSRTVGPRPYSATYEATVFQPSFHFRKEGVWGYEASLGTTPLGGEVHPAITGHFDFVHHNKEARYSLGVHRNSIYESILSVTGLKDTVTGQSYGRVVETGLHASIYQPMLEDWALTGEARWAERTGENVDTNQTRFFNVAVVYNFDAAGFSYLAVGPSFRSESFDDNRSFFTFGHGGYYSPAEVNNASLNVSFLTEEKKNWIVRGFAGVGYEEAESDPAAFYPLNPLPGDPVYAGTSSDGVAVSFEAVAARRLSDTLIGEAGIYGINTDDYAEAGVFLKLRYVFGKRSEVYRSDLTESLHRKYH